MKRVAPWLLAACVTALPGGTAWSDPGQAAPDRQPLLTFQPIFQYFLWEEFFGEGQQLEEKGVMPGLAVDYIHPLTPRLTLHMQSRAWAGEVDYNGYVVNIFGQSRPYETETRYFGIQGDADAAWDVTESDSFDLAPMAGLGFRYWLRQIDPGGNAGYDEYWATLHARAGFRLQWTRSPRDFTYLWAVAILPLVNDETAKDVPLSRSGSISLEPKKRAGFQAEAGMVRSNMVVALFFEALNFDQSEPDSSNAFVQPKSEMKVAGVKVGFVF